MKLAPILSGEAARLQALRQYGIVDVDPEPALDDIALLAAQICGTPIALLSLVESDRVQFKARVGFSARESPRELSFCAHAIYSKGAMVVPDARLDERFVDHPFCLGEPQVIFYAGEPLVTPDGHPIGTLCVIDHEPRVLSADQLSALAALSRQVVAQFELRRKAALLRETAAELSRADVELRASRVHKGLVQMLISSVESFSGPTGPARRRLGRSLGASSEGTLDARLALFEGMGSGRLALMKDVEARLVFEGTELLESASRPGREPACSLALGYLEGVVSALRGGPSLGTETSCRAQGHSRCTFHVRVGPAE